MYLTVVTEQPPIDPKVVTKRSPSGHKLIGIWPLTHQLVTKRPPSYPKEVNKWLPIDPILIPKWSKCGHQTAINVVWKQQAIPKWSPSSQQKIQKWSPSNHQLTKWSPSSNQMVHRLSQSYHGHKMIQFQKKFWRTTANIRSQFIHLCLLCNVGRNWQSIEWGLSIEWIKITGIEEIW